jgi:hypothetical protein
MSFPDRDTSTVKADTSSAAGTAEASLRLIAKLPPPAGLEERVRTRLVRAGNSHRVLSWPDTARPASGWMRSAAAAAIVLVVAGGGWGIYSRVQKPMAAKVIVMPHGAAAGGFSNAGAMRTPKTLSGPVLADPSVVPLPPAKARIDATAKSGVAKSGVSSLHPAPASKVALPPVAPLAK